jgi:HEAT repeat protein
VTRPPARARIAAACAAPAGPIRSRRRRLCWLAVALATLTPVAARTARAAASKPLGEAPAAAPSGALEPLLEGLIVGAPPERALRMLEGLTKLGDPRAIEVLELYAGHRRPELRRQAVRALGGIAGPRVVPALLERLGDSAPEVRAAAAEVLATRREQRAVSRLFLLVKRGDAGAAAPLGLVATPDLIPQLAELQGSVEEGVLATALGEYLKRDDVADRLRVDILHTIDKLPGPAATTALIEYVGSIPARDERPSKKEAHRLIDRRASQ